LRPKIRFRVSVFPEYATPRLYLHRTIMCNYTLTRERSPRVGIDSDRTSVSMRIQEQGKRSGSNVATYSTGGEFDGRLFGMADCMRNWRWGK
jgi:hypothetical protein